MIRCRKTGTGPGQKFSGVQSSAGNSASHSKRPHNTLSRWQPAPRKPSKNNVSKLNRRTSRPVLGASIESNPTSPKQDPDSSQPEHLKWTLWEHTDLTQHHPKRRPTHRHRIRRHGSQTATRPRLDSDPGRRRHHRETRPRTFTLT